MLTADLAQYVLTLEDAAGSSSSPTDRAAYEKYRAHAGLVLALAVTGKDATRLREELEAHDRLWVHMLLVGDAYRKPADAWQKVKEKARL
jgi:hypothetical protein